MNLKINIKRPQITKEEIAANKNFGELLRLHKASAKSVVPFYKSTWFYTGLSAAAAVVVALILFVTPAGNKDTLAFIHPPFENVKMTSSQYSVNADLGATITCKTGSVIKIQPKSFVDKSGKPVSGKVDLTYREYKEPIDFFLSGIPMNYDSAGVSYTLESAGIVEIHASQQGIELEVSPDKEFAVALASHESGKGFNMYQLDMAKKQWMYSGKGEPGVEDDKAGVESAEVATGNSAASPDITPLNPQLAVLSGKLEHTEYEYAKSQELVKRLEAARPFEPKEETKGRHRFSVPVSNIRAFPEFAGYKDIMFQAADQNLAIDKSIYSTDWEGAKLSVRGSNYILTLQKEDLTASYIVHPVFEGEGYNEAQKIYTSKLAEYEEALIEHKATEGEKQQELAALVEVMKDNRDVEVARLAKEQEELNGSAAHTGAANPGNLTFHNFSVHSCGIWNLGRPALLPQGAMVNARFTDEKGKELQFASGRIYLVEKGRNILFSFAGSNAISYNPEKENILWGITKDNKIAVFRYEDFKAAGKLSGDYTFVMELSDGDLADEGQVEYFLSI